MDANQFSNINSADETQTKNTVGHSRSMTADRLFNHRRNKRKNEVTATSLNQMQSESNYAMISQRIPIMAASSEASTNPVAAPR